MFYFSKWQGRPVLLVVAAFFFTAESQQSCLCGKSELLAELEHKTLLTPNYPNNYPPNIDCRYSLKPPPYFTTVIQVNSFQTHKDAYFSINATSLSAKWMLRKSAGDRIEATGNVQLRFHSNGTYTGPGFNISYYVKPMERSDCGAVRRTAFVSQHFISSPNYPRPYPAALRCHFIIPSTSGYETIIRVYAFLTEPLFDFLSIYSVDSDTTSLSGGKGAGVVFRSRSDLFMYFKSDGGTSRRGFNISYYIQQTATNPVTTPVVRAFTYLASLRESFILSPHFPSKYPNDIRHAWLIHVPSWSSDPSARIELRVLTFATECGNDRVTLTCGARVVTWHGKVASGSTFIGYPRQPVRVTFESDSSVAFIGFKIVYILIEAQLPTIIPTTALTGPYSCGRSYYATSVKKRLTSPLYPDSYPPSLHCFYTLTSNDYDEIFLEIDVFSTEEEHDYLSISSGSKGTVQWSGQKTSGSYSSHGTILLEFVSDSTFSGKGFAIYYCTNDCFNSDKGLKLSVGLIVPSVIIIIIVITACCCYCRRKRRSQATGQQASAQYPAANDTVTFTRPATQTLEETSTAPPNTSPPEFNLSPPSYEDFISNPDRFQEVDDDPPPYVRTLNSTPV